MDCVAIYTKILAISIQQHASFVMIDMEYISNS